MFQFLSRNSHLSILFLRVAAAMIFVYHGYMKLFVSSANAVANFERMGFPWPETLAKITGGIEFFGGLMVGLGLLARQAGLVLAVVLLILVIVGYRRASYPAIEHELQLLVLCIAIMFSGSGRWSIESMVRKHGD